MTLLIAGGLIGADGRLVPGLGQWGIPYTSIAVGGDFPSPLANDGPDSGSYATGDLVAWSITSVPSTILAYVEATDTGELVVLPGAPDGSYAIEYTTWVYRVADTVYTTGGPFTATIGSGVTAVGNDAAGAYVVLAAVGQDGTGSYPVLAAVGSDASGSYSVLAAVGQDASGTYQVLQAVGQDGAGAYVVEQAGVVGADGVGAYDVLEAVGRSSDQAFDVLEAVGADAGGSYSVGAAVGSDGSGAYAVLAPVGGSGVGAFDILAAVGASGSGSYLVDALASVGADGVGSYIIFGTPSVLSIPVSSIPGRAIRYSGRGRVLQTSRRPQ